MLISFRTEISIEQGLCILGLIVLLDLSKKAYTRCTKLSVPIEQLSNTSS